MIVLSIKTVEFGLGVCVGILYGILISYFMYLNRGEEKNNE